MTVCFKMHSLTLCRLVGFRDSHAKTTGSHVALRTRNSGTRSGRELFKDSKDAASLQINCSSYTTMRLVGS